MAPMNFFRTLWNGQFITLVAVAGLAFLFAAPGAKAGGCAAVPFSTGSVVPVAYSLPARGDEPQNGEGAHGRASIVGLWHLIYTATDANGPFPPTPFQFLESYKTWHGDGTEFENAFLPPSGGDICFGVWKEVGHGKIKLHHIGLMFSGAVVSNVFTVDETDTVAPDGKTYTGFFDFKLFEPTDVFGAGTPLAEVKGTTAGTRITVD